MKNIINKEDKELKFSFEGTDYKFPNGKLVQVEEALYDHLKGIVPLAFDFNPKVTKKSVAMPVIKEKTHVAFTGGIFGKASRPVSTVDQTPQSGTADKDGVEWYGEGLENDTP